MMREKIKIVENGKARTISLWEAVGRTLRNKALKGDQKAIELLINLEPLIEDRGAPLPKLGKTSTPEEAAEVYQRLIRSVPLRR